MDQTYDHNISTRDITLSESYIISLVEILYFFYFLFYIFFFLFSIFELTGSNGFVVVASAVYHYNQLVIVYMFLIQDALRFVTFF